MKFNYIQWFLMALMFIGMSVGLVQCDRNRGRNRDRNNDRRDYDRRDYNRRDYNRRYNRD
jgi:hypothetical protein